MNTLTSFRFDAWTDGPRNACAIQWDREAPGLERTWFVLEESELHGMAMSTVSALEDGYHKLSRFGDSVTFYDFMPPGSGAGEVKVKYATLNMPRAFWRYLERIARTYWNLERRARAVQDSDTAWRIPRLETVIPQATLARFVQRYGHGRGAVNVETTERLRAEMASDELLRERVEYVTRIAQNSTRSVYQTARLAIQNDGESYYWCAIAPSGRRVMNGGIIKHDRDGSHEWGIPHIIEAWRR